MPSILIDFDDRRDVYDVPDRSDRWQKVVELDVGEAPNVDVFFKSGTQEIKVKSFKFATQKERRVAVTVTVDATNTVTAKLVALANTETNSDDSQNDGMIVSLDRNGMAIGFTRTNELPICPITSYSGATGEQLDAAAATAALVVPPSRAASVFILPYTANYQYADRKRMVDALEGVGYSNVHCFEQLSPQLSTALKVAKPNNQVGDYVGILEANSVHVVRKTDHGYDYVQFVNGVKRLRKQFPTIKEIISWSIMFCGLDDDEQKKIKIQYHPLPVNFVPIPMDYLTTYMWNKSDGGNMDGYLVTMPVQCKFRINYNGKNTVIDAKAEMLPWQKAVELKIGDATTIDVFMEQDEAYHGEVHVKQFKFTSKKTRKVFISIAIDDARLPEVKMTTL